MNAQRGDVPHDDAPPPPRPVRPGPSFDLAVVGAGIVGLAHAAEAVQRGLSVCVLERDQRAVGASLRNFGHVCATAQDGAALEYAWRARERWLQLADKAGIAVVEAGTVVVARSAAEMTVLEEFAAARGGEQVRLLDAAGVLRRVPVACGDLRGGALLPLDLRLDPLTALPRLAAWLADEGVEFRWGTHVGLIADGTLHTPHGTVTADRVVHAAGHDLDRLFPALAEQHGVRRCRLHMVEVAAPGAVSIAPAVLTGTSMLRYRGLAAMPSAAAVRDELERARPELLAVAMNLMLTQRPDGAVVLGDTHHYDRTHLPFDDEDVAELVLREGSRLLGADLQVRRRWRGVYADSTVTDFVVAAPDARTRVVAVTSGIGMTTALGLAPAVLDQLA